jgi:predicted lipoprotein with Yx(FWY)xxD motif
MQTPKLLMTAATLGLAACATYSSPPPPYAGSVYDAMTITTADKAPFGTYLVDGAGRAVYILEGTRGTAAERCSGECLRVWPPLHVNAAATPGGAVDPARLGTIRAHGHTHVAYNGWLLFYYHHDRAPGDTTGQHVTDAWGTWHLLSPNGQPIRPVGSGY